MSLITLSVENIDSINPEIAPNYGVRSLSIECRMTDDQMLALLTQISDTLPSDKWQAWLDEEA